MVVNRHDGEWLIHGSVMKFRSVAVDSVRYHDSSESRDGRDAYHVVLFMRGFLPGPTRIGHHHIPARQEPPREGSVADDNSSQFVFDAHVGLLHVFLDQRRLIVDRIQDLLNAQRKPVAFLQDRPLLFRLFEDCFYSQPVVNADRARLRGQLQAAHFRDGFRPRRVPGLYNDLVNPAEMMIRGFYCWQQTRWPGRSGRVRYAETLFELYLLRGLEQLSLRIWDGEPNRAGERLGVLQALLDELRTSAPGDRPVLVRDARWLIPLAQSPTTDDLGAYFEISRRIESLSEADALEVRRASVCMIAGHLRSQMRHYVMRDNLSLDDESVIRRTRTSNALDFALLVQGLVPLLEAYETALERKDDYGDGDGGGGARRILAGTICQAISPDPELFLRRIELLRPYCMVEYLFTGTLDDGQIGYTPMGERQLRMLDAYEQLIGRLIVPLGEDCPRFRPAAGAYSPYGAIFGTPSNLTEDMALKTLQLDIETRFGLEDVFVAGGADKLDWVNGWRQLPHVDREVREMYEYPQQFAEAIFDRIERAFDRNSAEPSPAGRLFVQPTRDVCANEAEAGTESEAATEAAAATEVPDLAARYLVSSDAAIVDAGRAEPRDETQLLRDRQEGYFLVSCETSGGWLAVRKDCITEVLGAGRDARITALPPPAAEVLRLMCPHLVAPDDTSDQASRPPSMVKA